MKTGAKLPLTITRIQVLAECLNTDNRSEPTAAEHD